MWSPWEYLLFALGALLYAYWAYQMSIAVNGFRAQPLAPRAAPNTRFAVLIPAHNEELVIGPLLDSLNAQTYPCDRVTVYVSCDGCTDATPQIATERGARVLRRDERTGAGKTANLRWALGQIPLGEHDALVLFDADNLAREDFLERMNDYLAAHPDAQAIQGYLETKNPHDSWVTRVYAISFWYTNQFWHRARSNAGLSINLGGTGVVLRVRALRDWGWSWESLADDLELTCRIILGGGLVHWCDDAVAYDEKPITARASRSQRSRWLQGHYYLMARYARPALSRFLWTGRRQYLDLFLHLLAPGRAATSYLAMFGGFVILTVRWWLDPSWLAHDPLWWTWLAFALFALAQAVLVLVVAPSLHSRKVELRYVPDILSFAAYGVRWIPSMLSAIAASRSSRAWVKTEHTRSLSLDDLRRKH
jgi:cellulose synthase/poly-beta-1,6-N-acetylglucosamine synthase-like glycosyltransferase